MSLSRLNSAAKSAFVCAVMCLLTACANRGNSFSNPVPTNPQQTKPLLTWKSPAPVTVGATLGTTQLNATSNVPGSFTYSPAAGTALTTAGTTALSVVFTPEDSNQYSTATSGVSLTVNAAPPLVACATPMFSPVPGQFSSAQEVTLSTTTQGATIYYTTDGSAPTTSSQQYEGPISIGATTVIEAITVGAGSQDSGLARGDYVIKQATATGPQIPENATAVTEIQTLSDWKYKHDSGTKGSSTGSMTLVNDPAVSGESAKFDSSFKDWGGERYSSTWANDADATNFLYDAEVWIEAGSKIGNLEMDNNQVIPNGDTVIYAFQCAGDSNTWDYSENAGTPKHPNVKWLKSKQQCNPATWTPNEWHHIQISYSRDESGNVTYQSVWFDGVEQPINETVPGAFSLGWGIGDLKTNFQVDGFGVSGSSVLYLDNLTFYRW